MFEFIQENNQFCWQNDEIKIVFSDQSFQAFDEDAYITTIKQIMYYYYTISIYRKGYDKNYKKPWIKVISKNTYDFPCIEQLISMLNCFLNEEIKDEDCRKITYYTHKNSRIEPNNIVGYEYIMKTEGFACDDFYQIERTKIVNDKDITETFDIYIGATVNEQGGLTNVGVMAQHIEKKDLKTLYECVTKFVEYSIKIHNDQIKQSLSTNNIFFTNGEKLYEKKGNTFENVYIIGTKCDITELLGSLDDNDYFSQSFYNVTITSIHNNMIHINDGFTDSIIDYDKEKGYDIPCDAIISIFGSAENYIKYNIEEIVDDWISILNDDEKIEFKISDVDTLYKKWCEAIINKTWMFREEHKFEQIVEDYKKNVYEIVKLVIKQVKNKLNR